MRTAPHAINVLLFVYIYFFFLSLSLSAVLSGAIYKHVSDPTMSCMRVGTLESNELYIGCTRWQQKQREQLPTLLFLLDFDFVLFCFVFLLSCSFFPYSIISFRCRVRAVLACLWQPPFSTSYRYTLVLDSVPFGFLVPFVPSSLFG